jgi:predicted phosphodiesterase
MARIAILSDIHGNLPALEAVLRDVNECGADRIVFLGDIVGYGASPAECVDLVLQHGGCCVMGNHDVEIRQVRRRGFSFRDPDWKSCGYQAGLAHAGKCLDAAQAEWLAALPYRLRIPGAVVAHASLHEPEAFDYIRDAETAAPTLAILRKEQCKVGFFGHTHETGIFAVDPGKLEWLDAAQVRIPPGMACAVTVGAVGQPRHETDRRASWVLWDPVKGVVDFRKTDYDRFKAVRDIIDAGLPLESGLRLLTSEELEHLTTFLAT